MDNEDLREDYWALNAALQYQFELDGDKSETDDALITRAYEALDAFKSRLGL